ncbi:response regulator transcription factor [Virgibacillus sp. 179-BFC.A HS]|uniref:Response regulator transcription factor n=1 Tax=Tigheibacillus jepli TaxID=3035914 RepID=A0ABU5CHB6_9BACI|nr:response regulator transcription factor [Virgibacillus sp. 179-BFC.A HS]MDY0404933.1 response regulator transcription factor [Virgibacillus sp. 179-BFC.A HS]
MLLVENQRLFSEGIQVLLQHEKDIQVVGVAEDGKTAVTLAGELLPDVILMEIQMPDKDGTEIARELKEINSKFKIVFLTNLPEEKLIMEALEVGASGFLSKTLLPNNLFKAIRDAHSGQYVLSGDVAEAIIRHIKGIGMSEQNLLDQKLRNIGVELSQRELDIIMLLFKGNSNREISEKIGLNVGTVKNYVSSIYHKINVHYRKEAIAFFRELMES